MLQAYAFSLGGSCVLACLVMASVGAPAKLSMEDDYCFIVASVGECLDCRFSALAILECNFFVVFLRQFRVSLSSQRTSIAPVSTPLKEFKSNGL